MVWSRASSAAQLVARNSGAFVGSLLFNKWRHLQHPCFISFIFDAICSAICKAICSAISEAISGAIFEAIIIVIFEAISGAICKAISTIGCAR